MTLDRAQAPSALPVPLDEVDDVDPAVLGRVLDGLRALPTAPARADGGRDGDGPSPAVPLPRRRR